MERITELKFQKMTHKEMSQISGGMDVFSVQISGSVNVWSGQCAGKQVLAEYDCITMIDGSQVSMRQMGPTAWQKFWTPKKNEAKFYCDQTDDPKCS